MQLKNLCLLCCSLVLSTSAYASTPDTIKTTLSLDGCETLKSDHNKVKYLHYMQKDKKPYLKADEPIISYFDDNQNRMITDKEQEFLIELPSDATNTTIVETKRNKRGINDLNTIISLVKASQTVKTEQSGKTVAPSYQCALYVQKYDRSVIVITPAKDKSAKDGKPSDGSNTTNGAKGDKPATSPGKDGKANTPVSLVEKGDKPAEGNSDKLAETQADDDFGKATLYTGSTENIYFSADLNFADVKQGSLDANLKPTEKYKPNSFYIGMNYKLGDVVNNVQYKGSESWKNLSAKLLITASSTPLDSYGVGIGYEFPFATLFVADVWTKDDASTGARSTKETWIGGISFDLELAANWLSPSTSSK